MTFHADLNDLILTLKRARYEGPWYKRTLCWFLYPSQLAGELKEYNFSNQNIVAVYKACPNPPTWIFHLQCRLFPSIAEFVNAPSVNVLNFLQAHYGLTLNNHVDLALFKKRDTTFILKVCEHMKAWGLTQSLPANLQKIMAHNTTSVETILDKIRNLVFLKNGTAHTEDSQHIIKGNLLLLITGTPSSSDGVPSLTQLFESIVSLVQKRIITPNDFYNISCHRNLHSMQQALIYTDQKEVSISIRELIDSAHPALLTILVDLFKKNDHSLDPFRAIAVHFLPQILQEEFIPLWENILPQKTNEELSQFFTMLSQNSDNAQQIISQFLGKKEDTPMATPQVSALSYIYGLFAHFIQDDSRAEVTSSLLSHS